MSERDATDFARRRFVKGVGAALTVAPLMGDDAAAGSQMNDTFLKACRGAPVDYTPVWMMRQAGRYLPQYQKVLAQTDFLTAVRTPEIAAEITIQPVDIFGVDAAIFYSDITTVVVPMGMDLRYSDDKGPSYANPVRTPADADRLIVPDDPADGLSFVYEAQKICARELANRVPLIGFAGAPFTVCAYMVEGGPSHAFSTYRRLIFDERAAFTTLMDKVSQHTANYLKAQAAAGANALMLFDSNAGLLGPDDYESLNLPYVRRILAALKDTGVPLIYFGLGAHSSLAAIRDCGADVISIDYGLRLNEAVAQLGQNVSVQGNIEPYVLYDSKAEIRRRVAETLAAGKAARGHVFNLGHGVPRYSPVDNVKAMVDAVHELSQV
ncbi:MAG: uroporphyrinogen decarboxylase [Gammaproteobacteria bacterium]|nr:uroporphyrinogen decarboxylase [Gammaproteobacteria bacterium]